MTDVAYGLTIHSAWPLPELVPGEAGEEVIVQIGYVEPPLRTFLLGPALAVLLHQRGRLVLHAGAVAVNGRVAAFLGGPSWGKSTTTAALDRRGHGIMADDVDP